MKAKFTGHDTFSLRYGWPFKTINYIENNGLLSSADNRLAAEAVSVLGVGKNMINAMRYWSEAAALTESTAQGSELVQSPTKMGKFLLDEESGVDPFLENTGSIWLFHFMLNFNDDELTAYRYFFNYCNVLVFEKNKLLEDLTVDAAQLAETNKINKNTVKKDLDCFLNTYAVKVTGNGSKLAQRVNEDNFQSPLSELNLISDLGRGLYRAEPAERPTLPLEIFLYALVRFHGDLHSGTEGSRLSFEDLLTRPKSPGRIFRLSEAALGQLLDQAVTEFPAHIQWIDSLGLKQVVVSDEMASDSMALLVKFYEGDLQ
jgi:hypothetical protein